MIDQLLKELVAREMLINDRLLAVTYQLTEFGSSALDILE